MASALPPTADCCTDCGCNTAATLESIIASQLASSSLVQRIFSFDTLVALRASTAHVDNQVAVLEGLVSSGDGSGGFFTYKATDATADDGINYIKPDDVTGNGRWVRLI